MSGGEGGLWRLLSFASVLSPVLSPVLSLSSLGCAPACAGERPRFTRRRCRFTHEGEEQ